MAKKIETKNWLDFNSGLIQTCQWTFLVKTFACLRVAKIPKVFKPTSRPWATTSINTCVSRYEWWHFATFICLTTENQHFSFVIFFKYFFINTHPAIQRMTLFPHEAPWITTNQSTQTTFSVLLSTKNRGRIALDRGPANIAFPWNSDPRVIHAQRIEC